MKKISSIFQQILLGAAIGVCLGLCIVFVFPSDFMINFGLDTMIYFLVMIVVSFILQITIHEAGHLLFGKIAGFKFISFRIGSYVLTKEDKFKISRLRIAGTGGQCLMEPSKPDYNKYLGYLLGGSICNLVVAFFFFMLCLFNQDLLIDIFSFSMLTVGMLLGLTNLIPMDIGIPNDGYNAYWITRNKDSMHSLYQQLMISKELVAGKGLDEVSDEYTSLYENANLNNPLNLCIEVNQASKLIHQGKFLEAKTLLERIRSIEMSDIYKNSITLDLVLIELLTSDCIDVDQYLNDKDKKRLNTDKNNVDSLLCQYGIELLVNKVDADVTLKYFNDACKNYPYQGVVQGLNKIRGKLEERSQQNG